MLAAFLHWSDLSVCQWRSSRARGHGEAAFGHWSCRACERRLRSSVWLNSCFPSGRARRLATDSALAHSLAYPLLISALAPETEHQRYQRAPVWPLRKTDRKRKTSRESADLKNNRRVFCLHCWSDLGAVHHAHFCNVVTSLQLKHVRRGVCT